ncbi:thiol-disulfide oxidoreductase DCC family protein [Salisaeta longa]|uniref:thiol-disulfide oxidoreductase DCC family protein n=1 Tax=Salisaeta longa TaxID=503170 RepID=UPI0003B60E15|nr:thiol-disulfide oxidoreductase DCC family protein [Salisaeta longa]
MAPIVLFDGVCNLCNGAVDFVMRHDAHERFRFASLQSEVGETLLQAYNLPATLDSLVVIADGRAYTQSEAVLRIVRDLSWPGAPVLAVLLGLIPKPVRDAVYRWVAAQRYDWFGTRDTCRVPTPEERARFVTAPDDIDGGALSGSDRGASVGER